MRFCLVVCLFALSACSQMGSRNQSSSSRSELGSADGPLQVYRSSESESQRVVDPELETIPTEMNSLVEKWIFYFQGRGRPHMERYLARSTRYSGIMKKILRQNGLPEDLIYIALIESGFSSRATSRAAAVGYWQFIRGTGRRYSLEINAMIDERRDPILSTQAAAEYFKGLYSVFGSWYLAMASYNVGENRVKREVMNHYTRDFWELARKKRFPKETINYVPKFIAAKLIGRNPEKYGFTEIDYEKPLEFETLRVAEPVNLRKMSEVLGLEYEDLKALNPKFKGEIAPLKNNAHLDLRVPLGMRSQGLAAAQAAKVDKVEFIADSGETDLYRVRSGDSLYIIAKRYRTTVAWLKDANDLKAGRKLRVGQRILVPERSGVSRKKPVMVARGPKPAEERSAKEVAQKSPEIVTPQGVFYVVQAGDTLSAIADDYDSSVRELRRMNQLRQGQTLQVGQRLRVPKDEGLPGSLEAAAPTAAAPAAAAPAAAASAAAASAVAVTSAVASTAAEVVAAVPTNALPTAALAGKDSGLASNRELLQHVVRRGENLSSIAKKYGVSVQELKRLNNLDRRSVLKVGARLSIPVDGGGVPGASVSPSSALRRPVGSKSRVHIVKRGENLQKIAQRYSVSLDKIKRANNLKTPHVVAGSKLTIPFL